jgi:hypothetical protein
VVPVVERALTDETMLILASFAPDAVKRVGKVVTRHIKPADDASLEHRTMFELGVGLGVVDVLVMMTMKSNGEECL